VSHSKTEQKNSNLFIRELKIVAALSAIFLALLAVEINVLPTLDGLEPIMVVNVGLYYIIVFLIWRSAKLALANKTVSFFFLFEFVIIAIYSTFLLTVYSQQTLNIYIISYNLNFLIVPSILLMTTTYVFFYSLTPKLPGKKIIYLSILISLVVTVLVNLNLDLSNDLFRQTADADGVPKKITENAYYVHLINLSFLIFIWVTYHQGNYILSEYLPSVISMHTLMIMNEIYQLYNVNNLIINYVPAQYFNMLLNIGFISVWMVRLRYISDPKNKKNEHYVLNYDLLRDYVNKPKNNILEIILKKWGRMRVYTVSFFLFLMICIPLLFLGNVNHFMRINMLLLVFFWMGGMVYAVYYTQKRWLKQIRFMINKPKKRAES